MEALFFLASNLHLPLVARSWCFWRPIRSPLPDFLAPESVCGSSPQTEPGTTVLQSPSVCHWSLSFLSWRSPLSPSLSRGHTLATLWNKITHLRFCWEGLWPGTWWPGLPFSKCDKTLQALSDVSSLILCKMTFSSRRGCCTLVRLNFCEEISASGIYIRQYRSLNTSWRGWTWYFILPSLFLLEVTEFPSRSLAALGTRL